MGLQVKILDGLSLSMLENSIETFLRGKSIAGTDVFRVDISVVRGQVIGKGTSPEGTTSDTYYCAILYKS